MLLAGAGYDGFLPYPSISITADVSRKGRFERRNAHGSIFRRFISRLWQLFPGQHRWHSGFGADLLRALVDFELGGRDIIIIPTATIDDLSSVVDAYIHIIDENRPRCYVRFLDPHLGESSDHLREAEMNRLLTLLPKEIHLYCETEEMANYMSGHFRHQFGGGFYLPCTFDPRTDWNRPQKRLQDPFRVGVFGTPRKEKGSARIGNIIKLINDCQPTCNVEFAVQGHESDFQPEGVYGTLTATGSQVTINRLIGALEPDEFRSSFLSCDAILLPYHTSIYSLQGSGLVQDAVAAVIPIIFSSGMSMQRFLKCGNSVPASADKEFARAILTLATDRKALLVGCQAANEVFREALANHPMNQP